MGGSRPKSTSTLSGGSGGSGGFMGTLVHDGLGGKTIGFFAGVALLINNITGPGVPSLPNMFAEAGWLFPTVCFVLVWAMSSISTTMYCEAMRKIPGNSHFRGRIEYTSIVKYYFGRKAYVAAQIGLNGALQSLNIISVIQSAQVMDNAISAIFGHSCGVNISPFALEYGNSTVMPESIAGWSCIDTNHVASGNPWGCHLILSMGFLVALLITLPMGYFNLDDNMIVQVIAFVITILCWVIWFVCCFFSPAFAHEQWHIPAVTDSTFSWASQAGVIGTILFNFGFVTTVPSWVNEKKAAVSVNKVVWLSTFLCCSIFFLMGVPPAMAFQQHLAGPATGSCDSPPCAQDLMGLYTSDLAPQTLQNSHAMHTILLVSVYLFPVAAVLSSIPVFSIVIKYNCIENGWSKRAAFVWGVLFPWIVAIPLLYQPDALNQFITFSSLIFVSFTDFIVPWGLYIILQKQERSEEERLVTSPATYGTMDEAPMMTASVRPSLSASTRKQLSSFSADLSESEEESDNDVTQGDPHQWLSTSSSEVALLNVQGSIDETVTNGVGDPYHGVAEHSALPESWRISPEVKLFTAAVLVVVMTVAAIAGTVLQIQTSATIQWNCTAVAA
eukprot:m.247901 g.247901  ORF g.247901 m.247901 type:complete len:614 (-) comp15402_c1_seq1:776-2617(-)